jgi:hypothetical protein
MRVMILTSEGFTVTVNQLQPFVNAPVVKNQYPDDGITIIDQNNEPEWSWPDVTIRLGLRPIGRNHADITIAEHEDPIGSIVSYLAALDENAVTEE